MSTARLEARAERLTWRLLRWLNRRAGRRRATHAARMRQRRWPPLTADETARLRRVAVGDPFPDAEAPGEHATERLARLRRRADSG